MWEKQCCLTVSQTGCCIINKERLSLTNAKSTLNHCIAQQHPDSCPHCWEGFSYLFSGQYQQCAARAKESLSVSGSRKQRGAKKERWVGEEQRGNCICKSEATLAEEVEEGGMGVRRKGETCSWDGRTAKQQEGKTRGKKRQKEKTEELNKMGRWNIECSYLNRDQEWDHRAEGCEECDRVAQRKRVKS